MQALYALRRATHIQLISNTNTIHMLHSIVYDDPLAIMLTNMMPR